MHLVKVYLIESRERSDLGSSLARARAHAVMAIKITACPYQPLSLSLSLSPIPKDITCIYTSRTHVYACMYVRTYVAARAVIIIRGGARVCGSRPPIFSSYNFPRFFLCHYRFTVKGYTYTPRMRVIFFFIDDQSNSPRSSAKSAKTASRRLIN